MCCKSVCVLILVFVINEISRVADNSIRYVAEENIEIVKPEYPLAVIGLAGRFFKRWDRESHRFISNIQDEYPED
jgi:F-box protein 21